MTKALDGRENIHGTAIVIGTRGYLFVGPSGIGKSSLALACMAAAHQRGLFSAFVADDQVFVEAIDGHAIASRPASTAGLIEIRYSGIAGVASIEAAVLHQVIEVVDPGDAERLPEPGRAYTLPFGLTLPSVCMARHALAPLAVIDGMAWPTVAN